MNCPDCKFQNPEDANFCMKCGYRFEHEVLSPARQIDVEGERKQATVMFSDLSGYTAMTEKLDPEEVKTLMGDIFKKAEGVVKKYGGTVERFFGDEVMILFGVPRAHEDDPVRAVHAASEIHKLVENLSPAFEKAHQTPLKMHTGINTGLVITGDEYIGKGRHGLTGDTINLAKRLTSLAMPGQIVVGENTFQKTTRQFLFTTFDPVTVKGKSDPVNTHLFQGVRKKSESISTGASRQIFSELVGREKELNKLILQLAQVIDGKGSVINITGEAGIGKSRLFAEFSNSDMIKSITLLEGKAISIGRTLPFYPFVDFLKNWTGIEEEDSETTALNKLERLVESIDRNCVEETIPFVATLMGMNLPKHYQSRLEGITGDALEKMIFKNLRELLIKASEIKPLVIVMEDLHWTDDSSLELLEFLFNMTQHYSVLFINVFRPGFESTGDRILHAVQTNTEIYAVNIPLSPLSPDISEQLVRNLVKISGMPTDLRDRIIERAGGNPFFIEEMVRSMIDEGAIIIKDNTFVITNKIDSIQVPHTIADLLAARIDRLEDRTRELVRIASVIGRNFFHKILKQVAVPVEDMDAKLKHLTEIQLIRKKDQSEELEYLFKHALAQEVAYQSLLLEKRKQLHLHVAQSIEAVFKERLHEFYGTLSYHYSSGGDLDKAEQFMLKAGEEAVKASASSEALTYYQQAMDLYIQKHGENVDRFKIAALQENIGDAFFYKGLYIEAFQYYNKAGVNRGEKKWRLNTLEICRMLVNFMVILRHLYLPGFGKKTSPSIETEDRLKKNLDKALSLVAFDTLRCLAENMKNLRQAFSYDISTSKHALNWIAGGLGLFTLTGISLQLSATFNRYIKKNAGRKMRPKDNIFYLLNIAVYDLHSGNWHEKLRKKVVDQAIIKGDFFPTTAYLLFSGHSKIEIADFKTAQYIIEKQTAIGDEYNFIHALSDAFVLKSKLALKKRVTGNALSHIEKGVALCRKDGWQVRETEFLGIKARLHMIDHNFESAAQTIEKARLFIEKLGVTSFAINWLGDYYTACFEYDLHCLEQAVLKKDPILFSEYKKKAVYSGMTAVKHAKKVASERTETSKFMGIYYRLINNPRKALQWWRKAIEQGEQLNARIELSRTYFEVGKHLQSKQSTDAMLNGVTAAEYLERAKAMFEEMGLTWDLKNLEKHTMEN